MYGIGRGNMTAMTYAGDKWIQMKLMDVVYVPEGHANFYTSSKTLVYGHTLNADADTFVFTTKIR